MLRVTRPFVWLLALALFSCVMEQGAQAENRGCEEGARLRSFASRQAATIAFVNRSSDPVQIFWIDYQGEKKSYTFVGSGFSKEQPTYLFHPWIVADRFGNCEFIVLATKPKLEVVVKDQVAPTQAPERNSE